MKGYPPRDNYFGSLGALAPPYFSFSFWISFRSPIIKHGIVELFTNSTSLFQNSGFSLSFGGVYAKIIAQDTFVSMLFNSDMMEFVLFDYDADSTSSTSGDYIMLSKPAFLHIFSSGICFVFICFNNGH